MQFKKIYNDLNGINVKKNKCLGHLAQADYEPNQCAKYILDKLHKFTRETRDTLIFLDNVRLGKFIEENAAQLWIDKLGEFMAKMDKIGKDIDDEIDNAATQRGAKIGYSENRANELFTDLTEKNGELRGLRGEAAELIIQLTGLLIRFNKYALVLNHISRSSELRNTWSGYFLSFLPEDRNISAIALAGIGPDNRQDMAQKIIDTIKKIIHGLLIVINNE